MIGYEINKVKKFVIEYDNCVIGGYGCTFNQRSAFIYMVKDYLKGYAIRKNNWHKLMSDNPEIASILKQNVLLEYVSKIRCKIIVKKREAIKEIYDRKDHQMVLVTQFKEQSTFKEVLESNFKSGEDTKDLFYDPELEELRNYYRVKLDEYENLIKGLLDNIEQKDTVLLDMD
jgi:hypothetical protein